MRSPSEVAETETMKPTKTHLGRRGGRVDQLKGVMEGATHSAPIPLT